MHEIGIPGGQRKFAQIRPFGNQIDPAIRVEQDRNSI